MSSVHEFNSSCKQESRALLAPSIPANLHCVVIVIPPHSPDGDQAMSYNDAS